MDFETKEIKKGKIKTTKKYEEVFSNPVISFIQSFLVVGDLLHLRLVSPFFTFHSKNFSQKGGLLQLVTHKLKRVFSSEAIQTLHAMQAILSGSFLLQCLYNEFWESDIDMYIPYSRYSKKESQEEIAFGLGAILGLPFSTDGYSSRMVDFLLSSMVHSSKEKKTFKVQLIFLKKQKELKIKGKKRREPTLATIGQRIVNTFDFLFLKNYFLFKPNLKNSLLISHVCSLRLRASAREFGDFISLQEIERIWYNTKSESITVYDDFWENRSLWIDLSAELLLIYQTCRKKKRWNEEIVSVSAVNCAVSRLRKYRERKFFILKPFSFELERAVLQEDILDSSSIFEREETTYASDRFRLVSKPVSSYMFYISRKY